MYYRFIGEGVCRREGGHWFRWVTGGLTIVFFRYWRYLCVGVAWKHCKLRSQITTADRSSLAPHLISNPWQLPLHHFQQLPQHINLIPTCDWPGFIISHNTIPLQMAKVLAVSSSASGSANGIYQWFSGVTLHWKSTSPGFTCNTCWHGRQYGVVFLRLLPTLSASSIWYSRTVPLNK